MTTTTIPFHAHSDSQPIPRWSGEAAVRELMITIATERKEALETWSRMLSQMPSVAVVEDAVLVTRDEFGGTVCVEAIADARAVASVHATAFWEVFFHAILQAPTPTLDIDTGVHRATSLVLSQLNMAGIAPDDVLRLRRSLGPGDTLLAFLATGPADFPPASIEVMHFAFPHRFEQVVRSALFGRRRTIRRLASDEDDHIA